MDHQSKSVRLQRVSASSPYLRNNNNNFETDFQSFPISNFVLQYTAYWILSCVLFLKNNENNINLNSVCKWGMGSVSTPDCNSDTNWSTCLSGRIEEKIITPLWFYFHGLQDAIREDQVKSLEKWVRAPVNSLIR